MNCLIYKISNNINDKIYIGQTWKSLSHRLDQHKRQNGCIKLYNAINKYDFINFKIELITITHTQECADYWEKYFINYYDTINNGYNLMLGGANGKHSEETKIKISLKMKGIIKSEETKINMSKAKQGKKFTEEAKINMSIAHKGQKSCMEGKTHSDESKQKMSKYWTGRKKPWLNNQIMSDETKQKMAAAKRGRRWTLVDGKRVWSLPENKPEKEKENV